METKRKFARGEENDRQAKAEVGKVIEAAKIDKKAQQHIAQANK